MMTERERYHAYIYIYRFLYLCICMEVAMFIYKLINQDDKENNGYFWLSTTSTLLHPC
jgi:hypothetical protein